MKKVVHSRRISIQSYDLGSGCILVEGKLKDHGHLPKHKRISDEVGIVHDMLVRLKVRGPGMLIERAEAEMPHHPRKECPQMLPSIRNLEGIEIAPGFTLKVKKTLGGTKGCAHLTSLIIAMGDSAVQGYWAAYAGRNTAGRREEIKTFINTCHVWKEDGPIVRELRQESQRYLAPERKKDDASIPKCTKASKR